MSEIERLQPPFGRLTWDERLKWWESGEIAILLFGGETTRISLDAEQDDFRAPFSSDVLIAATSFLALTSGARAEIEPHVWQEYVDMREVVAEEDCPVIARDQLWNNVQLNSVGIGRRHKDGLVYVSIECNCEWEIEHGLQLVLQGGSRWVRVSDYSGHYTEGDAYACDELDAWMSDPSAKLPVRSREDVLAQRGKYKRGKR